MKGVAGIGRPHVPKNDVVTYLGWRSTRSSSPILCKQDPCATNTTLVRQPTVERARFYSTQRKTPLGVVDWVLLSLNKKCAARSGVTAQTQSTKPIPIRYRLSWDARSLPKCQAQSQKRRPGVCDLSPAMPEFWKRYRRGEHLMEHERPNARRNLIKVHWLVDRSCVVLICLRPDRKLLMISTPRARRRTKGAPDTSTEGGPLPPAFN
jgi:hypothetical protein